MADTASPASPAATGSEPSRRDFIYIATGAVGAVGAAAFVWPLIDQMSPAADTLALASTEYDVGQVAEGQQVVIFWRGKPVFIRHRSAEEIAAAKRDDNADLRDPQTDDQRVLQANGQPGKPEYLIVEASCTHFGCVPTFGGGSYGGWLCACHGSVYDTAARIRGGPAPTNLVVPPYTYTTGNVVKIG
ncbi:MAG: ubiquinol-cytochrome c reductase iron-sulfur subunit [Hyphomonadaceae bacterium]|nr:ubiquinol-cytochrome c reductase iron-sulfur subunit [Hyphomonadaceae bacterium]